MRMTKIAVRLPLLAALLYAVGCAQTAVNSTDVSSSLPQTPSAAITNATLSGKTILVLGDSHMVHRDYLIDRLHEALLQQGATVYSYGACGATPSDYLAQHKTDCGRASRITTGEQKTEDDGMVEVWNAKTLLQQHHPDLIIIVMGDTFGYMKKDLNKAWIWDEVSALLAPIKSMNVSCNWVGPPWGEEDSMYGKSTANVKRLSDYLATIVAPCHYIDSTQFSKPDQWKTTDGQHLNEGSYREWATAIVGSVELKPNQATSNKTESAPW